jgi:uncharacterized protein
MAAAYNTIDLGRLSLSSGEGRRLDAEVRPGDVEIGGQPYRVAADAPVPARIDVSRTAAGYALRLRYTAELAGPCMRCLADARQELEIDAREIDQPSSGDEELESPYVVGDEVDLAGWAHDALVLALPSQILCRPDCAGLCAVCGASLNGADPADHRHGGPDGPFTKLAALLPDES